jgi:DNA-binding MarR family transcriptional regulator
MPDQTTRRLPETGDAVASRNLAQLLREPFLAMTGHLHRRLAEAGHTEVRPAHGAVFQFLDDAGTRVSALAERAQMTKQSMAELVAHLESRGYVERVPDPADRRARLVRATALGRELVPIARGAIAETEARWADRLGRGGMAQLRRLLEELNADL